MPNKLFNWTFKDVVSFLKEHGFRHHHIRGSHHYYIANRDGMHMVCVPFHGNKAIKGPTMKGIIRQSGIPKEEWFGE